MSVFLDAPEIAATRARLEHMRITGERLPPHEYPARRRDGSVVVAEITSMFIEHEGAPAVLGFARDVTERVRMRAQLAHAERLAAIGVLAAGVAHEINNPLTFVGLSAEMLLRRLNTRVAGKHELEEVESILMGTKRIAGIVRDLREYARQDDAQVGRCDLAAAIAAAERVVAHEIKTRARLHVDVGTLPPVLGAATRLEQVLVNLLLNAAHAIDEERVDGEIRVAARVTDRGVVVEVSDNGAGIAPDQLSRIFEPFFTTKGAGTGLGLSISRDIVTRFGGELAAESEPGRGTTMRVTLLCAPDGAAARDASVVPLSSAASPRRRILVIDDEQSVVQLVDQVLRERHDVVGTTDPHQGLERLLGDAVFDVVVCDLMMPSLTGMDLYASVAEAKPGMERRFLFATGGPTTDRARAFLAMIRNARLMKPFSVAQLEAGIEEAASGR
jgi:signal transduction histidine kinase